MPKLMAISLLTVLVKVSITATIGSMACGVLPQYNIPQLTHSNPTRQWPWHAAIFHSQTDSDPTYECGGTVVSQSWILTAAHCVSRKYDSVSMEPNQISVSLGKLNLSAVETRSEQTFDVTEIVIHENYSPTYLENDIALVRLSHPAIFNNFVRAICLWPSNETDISRVTERYGTVVGWGKTETYEVSTILQEAHLKVVSHARCLVSNRDFYGSYLTETNFCAGLQNGTSVCQGDSGSSMTIEENGFYYIRGIVSSSPSIINHTTQQLDCDTMQYAIYTDVAQYLEWISKIVGIDCHTIYRCGRGTEWGHYECKVDVHVEPSERTCGIIFDEIPDSTIKSLTMRGDLEFVPDLSDATIKFENLENLLLSNVKLKVVERVRLTALRRIKWLDLSKNQITHLDADTFEDLKDLRAIVLTSNTIKELHADTFKGLNHLEKVLLGDNKLEILPRGLFRDNHQLQRIDLIQNRLKELDVDIFQRLFDLESLYLYENQLENLPQDLFSDNQNLRVLSLRNNNFTADLPHNLFRNNKKLQEIGLSENRLSEIHADMFEELHDLTKISLFNNRLEVLPAGLFRYNKKMKEIPLNGNQLRELDADVLKGLYNLTIIHLGTNRLEILPLGLFRDNHQLQRIDLFQNRLKELDVDIFKELYNLESLYLYENQLESLPRGLFRDNLNLLVIGLQNNRILKVETEFSHLSKLKVLGMGGNVCIDESFNSSLLTLSEINNKIQTKCSN